MAFDYRFRRAPLTQLNLTPLLDTAFCLLIIFMVSAPLMTQGVEVDLPKTRTVRELPADKDHLVLSVKKDGTLYLDEYKVELDQLEGHLKTLVANQKKSLFLMADKEVPYGTVVTVMGEIKAAGIEKGSSTPNKDKVAKLTRDQLKDIATQKMKDLNTDDMDQAVRIIAGTARSMGIDIVD